LAMPEMRVGELLRMPRVDDAATRLRSITKHGFSRDTLRTSLLASYDPALLNFDAAGALSAWRLAKGQWFVPQWLGKRRLVHAVRSMSLTKQSIDAEAAERLLEEVVRYQKEERALQSAAQEMIAWVGHAAWAEGEADWKEAEALADWVEQAARIIAPLTDSFDEQQRLRNALADRSEAGRESFL